MTLTQAVIALIDRSSKVYGEYPGVCVTVKALA